MLLFYYNLGTALERTWGTYRYNVYIFSGMLFTIAGSFLCMGVLYLLTGGMATETASVVFYSGSYAFSTYYINLSIFLAFAATYPDMQVLLMFVIPVKVKWMGILDAILMVYTVIAGNLFTKFCGSGITFEFCVILLQTASQPYLAETDAPQGAVRTKIQCWTGESHKTQMCRLRTDRRGRSESGVPFLLQM